MNIKSLRVFVNTPRKVISVIMLLVFLVIWIMLFMIPSDYVKSSTEIIIKEGVFLFLRYIAVPLIIILLAIIIFQRDVF